MGEKENYTKEIITSILGVLILLVLIFINIFKLIKKNK